MEVKALHPWDNKEVKSLANRGMLACLRPIQAFGELANLIGIGNSDTLRNISIKLYDLLKLSNSSLLVHTQ